MKNLLKELGNFIKSAITKKKNLSQKLEKSISVEVRAELDAAIAIKCDIGRFLIVGNIKEGKELEAINDFNILCNALIKEAFMSGMLNTKYAVYKEFGMSDKEFNKICDRMIKQMSNKDYIDKFNKFFKEKNERSIKSVLKNHKPTTGSNNWVN